MVAGACGLIRGKRWKSPNAWSPAVYLHCVRAASILDSTTGSCFMSEQAIPADGAGRAEAGGPRVAGSHARGLPAPDDRDASSRLRSEYLALLEASRARLWLVAVAVTGDRTEADDVLQDAAMIGLAKFSEFALGSSFDAWMGQITRNVALNALRKRKRAAAALNDQIHSPELRAVSRVDTDDGEEVGGTGRASELASAVAGLDDVARTCLLLRVVGGLPYQAIAAIVQIPESTAMSHVYRSRGHLRSWMLNIEGTSGSDRPGGLNKTGLAPVVIEESQKTGSPPASRTGVAR